MKLSVLTVPLGGLPLRDACSFLSARGVQAVEIGCGGYPGKAHCNPADLLDNPAAIREFKAAIEDNGLELAALSCHGNYVHPDPAVAKAYQDDFNAGIRLAEQLGVTRVVGFSGCPGGAPGDSTPNWVTCPWPEDFLAVLDYQWNDVLIPYWQKQAAFAADHGITKIALEMHPGFCVYNPETLLKLRAAVGPIIGANLDPSHLYWQGMNIPAVIRYLGDAIHFFHAKDTKVDPINAPKIGVLDTKHYSDEINRAWIFRTVGYGHGMDEWKEIVSALRLVGYDDVLSIEHEDSLMSGKEGLEKAIAFLQQVLISEPAGGMYWA